MQQVEERDHECAGAHHPRGQRGGRARLMYVPEGMVIMPNERLTMEDWH